MPRSPCYRHTAQTASSAFSYVLQVAFDSHEADARPGNRTLARQPCQPKTHGYLIVPSRFLYVSAQQLSIRVSLSPMGRRADARAYSRGRLSAAATSAVHSSQLKRFFVDVLPCKLATGY
jgi:hypothetical protein